MQAQAGANHAHGITAQGPLVHLALFLFWFGIFVLCFLAQVTSTINAVFGLMQTGTMIDPHMTAQQVFTLLSGTMDSNSAIAQTTGWVVQGFMMSMAFPSTRAMLRMHKKHNQQYTSASIAKHDAWSAKVELIFKITLIGGDILTDLVWAARGHSIFGSLAFGFLPQVTNFGTLLGCLMYTACVVGGVMYCGSWAFARLGLFLEALMGARHGMGAKTP